jgi:uncharacterized Zn finger protein
VAKRRAQAMQKMEKLRKQGVNIQPVRIEGRRIARTFWGQSWCEHLEKFSDYENRLPRGRTYVRNGSVCHLDIAKGEIEAKVTGSEIYDVRVTIKALPRDKWQRVKDACVGQVGSLLELLQGKLSAQVMGVVTDQTQGLFPQPGEMSLKCSCPDWAKMCKHVAAVLYGIGARLDEKPELLFVLRGVDHAELVTADAAKAVVAKSRKTDRRTLDESELSEVFGIDVAPTAIVKATVNTEDAKSAGSARPRSARRSKAAKGKTVAPAPASRAKTKKAARKKLPGKSSRRAT